MFGNCLEEGCSLASARHLAANPVLGVRAPRLPTCLRTEQDCALSQHGLIDIRCPFRLQHNCILQIAILGLKTAKQLPETSLSFVDATDSSYGELSHGRLLATYAHNAIAFL